MTGYPVSMIALIFLALLGQGTAGPTPKPAGYCELEPSLVEEIQGYKTAVQKINEAVTNGKAKGKVYEELATFVDKFGFRMSGTKNLENAIDYMLNKSMDLGLDNVHGEPVTVPHWVRGHEEATLLKPRQANLKLLGLGGSVSTPKDGITAKVLVVQSFKELENRANEAKGKIVVFVEKWESYGKTVTYRVNAAVKTAEAGGVASLIRSITPFSISSPHTGWQAYKKGVKQIPTAAITVEDAEMLLRMSKRGEEIEINLKMEAKMMDPVQSRNTVVEVTGHENKDEYVLVSGHLDSWDVGDGAMDDGGGAFISWYSIVLLKQLGLVPKRTVRAVLWTGEEEGLIGAAAYKNANPVNNLVLAMESDEGTFSPRGISFKGVPKAVCIMKEVMKLMTPMNATDFTLSNDIGSDVMVWANSPVPLAALANANEKYFWFHHSDGDRMTVENSKELDKCLALWASVSYVVANLSVRLPTV